MWKWVIFWLSKDFCSTCFFFQKEREIHIFLVDSGTSSSFGNDVTKKDGWTSGCLIICAKEAKLPSYQFFLCVETRKSPTSRGLAEQLAQLRSKKPLCLRDPIAMALWRSFILEMPLTGTSYGKSPENFAAQF